MAQEIILVIDDHALFRSGIAVILATAFKGAMVLDCASVDQALAHEGLLPSIVLLDIQLLGRNGLDGIDMLRRRWPSVRIIMVSAHDRPATVELALDRGAAAFLSKADPPEHMISVLRANLDGSDPSPAASRGLGRPILTARQTEVLELVGLGLSNKMIGNRLGLSEHTVRGHVQALLCALGVSRRTEAIFKARQFGLIR